jgi:hypothetical protein
LQLNLKTVAMPLTLTPIDHKGLCHGWAWTIENEDLLAEYVARIALGQYRHIACVLAEAGLASAGASPDHARDAVKLLTVLPDEESWHRDGWVFQAISWIAAQKQAGESITRAPHIRKADKGFDGIQVELSEDGKSVSAVIVFEDKATGNARKTIREEVWPGIAALEAGERVAELTHEVSAILDTQRKLSPGLDVDRAIENILWKGARRYRVSITVSETHLKEDARARLFKGYEENAPGGIARRRAETIFVPELREWIESFAQRAICHVKSISPHV